MNDRTEQLRWRRTAAAAALMTLTALLLYAADAWGARVRVVLPDGSAYTGDWQGSSQDQFRIRLDDGTEKQLPFAGGVIVMTMDEESAFSPRPEAALRLRAGLDALDLGMLETAEENMRAAVVLSPRYADAHYALAQLLESQENAAAWDHYVWAAALNPQRYPVGGKVRAVVEEYVEQGDFFAAGRECARFAVHFTEDPSAAELAYLGAQYLLAAADDPDIGNVALKEAIAAYEYALQKHPERPEAAEARYLIGSLYVQTKQPDKAIQSATAALRDSLTQETLSPYTARLYLTLGYAYYQKGETALVTDSAQRALDADPDESARQEAQLLLSEVAWTLVTVENGFPSDVIFSLSADGSELLVGTSKGLARVNAASNPPTVEVNFLGSEIADGAVIRAADADANEIWVGSSGQGVFRSDTTKRPAKQRSMSPWTGWRTTALMQSRWMNAPSGSGGWAAFPDTTASSISGAPTRARTGACSASLTRSPRWRWMPTISGSAPLRRAFCVMTAAP